MEKQKIIDIFNKFRDDYDEEAKAAIWNDHSRRFREFWNNKISVLIEQARKKVAAAINQEMVILYWNIGKTIKDEIMKSDRAEYGEKIVQSLTVQ